MAPDQPFTDARTGQLYEDATQLYWKTLEKTVEEYIDHPESKFQNGDSVGKTQRRHPSINAIACIGKETNKLKES